MSSTKLFDHFEAVGAKAWKQQIQVALKGEDYNEKLVWESPEGIKVKPFYHAEDIADVTPPPASHKKAWKIGEAIYCLDVITANGKAQEVIRKGVQSLQFSIPSDTIDPVQLLKGIPLEQVVIHFRLQFLAADYIAQLLEIKKKNKGVFYFHSDIIGHLAKQGNWYTNLQEDHKQLEAIVSLCHTNTGVSPLSVDMALYQNAGGNMVQELAYACLLYTSDAADE